MNLLRARKGIELWVSKHFRWSEFACHCTRSDCKEIVIAEDLIDALEQYREMKGSPVKILSGHRCPAHNAEVGGARDSFHQLGYAADTESENPSHDATIAEQVPAFQNGGIGTYPKRGFIHTDVRGYPARWTA